ncbi:Autophagy protein 22 [Entomortierella chlamydospora]|nr:Autophagy protein 22 [Entomortierella chlamydospora]
MRISFSPAPAEPATTKKEIWAWYSYAFASEAYVVVALTSFIPITLEALASEQGHLYGTNEPCVSRPNATETATGIAAAGEKPRCMISFGRLEMDTASFVMYLTSLAVLLQALTVVSISAMADHGSYRKKQLIVFSAVGAISTMLIGAVPFVWMAGALSVIANVSFGAGVVCFNAYLPLLVRNVDRIRHQRDQILQLESELDIHSGRSEAGISTGETALAGIDDSTDLAQGAESVHRALMDHEEQTGLGGQTPLRNVQSTEERKRLLIEMSDQLSEDKGHLMGQISAKGFASGYFGGIVLLLVLNYDQKQMVLLLLVLLVMVPIYGTLGLILPFWPHLSSGRELFALAAYFGFLIGAVQSFCRSMFAGLVPRGRESEFFGLYAITDKGSSWLGPLAVATITDITHEIRHAFVFLLVLLSLPIPIIYFGVDMNQGRLDADKASLELQQAQAAGEYHDQDGGDESERLLSAA